MLRYAAENGYDSLTWTTGAQQAERYDLSKQVGKVEYEPSNELLRVFDKEGHDILMRGGVKPEGLEEFIGKEPAQRLIDAPLNKPEGAALPRDWPIEKVPQTLAHGADYVRFQHERVGEPGMGVFVVEVKPGETSYDAANRRWQNYLVERNRAASLHASPWQELTGDGLKIGGEGMAGFYDKILPDFARKYGKKWGATVGTTTIPVEEGEPESLEISGSGDNWEVYRAADPDTPVRTFSNFHDAHVFANKEYGREKVHSIDITPAMKDSVMQGQPLFAKGAEGTGAASGVAPAAEYRHGVVWVNAGAMKVIAKAAGESGDANGFYVPPMAAQKLARAVISKPGIAGPVRQAIAEASRHGGSIIVVSRDGGRALENLKATVRHERFHQAMGNLMGAARGKIFLQHPLAQLAADNLADRYDRDDEATMWAEIGAHLAAGPLHWERMGLDHEQAKELFRQYLKLLDDNTIRKIEHASPLLNEVLHGNDAIAAVRQAGAVKDQVLEKGPGRGQLRPGVRAAVPEEPDFVRLDRQAASEEAREAGEEPERLIDRLKSLPSETTGAVSIGNLSQSLQQIFGSQAPEANYSGLGAAKTRYIRNLSQTEMASTPAHTAGIRTAASRAQANAIVGAAVPVITRALEGSGVDWAEMRLALTQGRLNGLRDRWQSFSQEAAQMSDHDLEQAFTDHFADLLGAMEGKGNMPDDIVDGATALYALRDWDALRDYLDISFADAAASVATVMPPGRLAQVAANAGFRRALPIYKNLIEGPMAENHALNEGIFSNALGDFDTYIPLIPMATQPTGVPGRRLPYHKPKNIANKFATGLADAYDTSMEPFRERLARGIRSNDKASLIKTLEEEGLLEPAGRGQPNDTFMFNGREFEAETVELRPARQLIVNGKSTFIPAQMGVMPKWLAREMAPILERLRFDAPTAIDKVMNALNTVAVSGPADAVFHAANVFGALIANTPFLADTLAGKVLSAPIIKKFAALMYVAMTDPSTAEAAEEIVEMAKVGVLPDRYGSVTYSKRIAEEIGAKKVGYYSFSPFLYGPHGLDVRARLLMWRLAKSINPGATPQELFHFVNQLGNYVPALQGEVERAFKASGFSPFFTAGSTMIRNGVNAWTGAGPMPKGGAALRLYQQLTGGAIVFVALWALTYHAATGKWPWQDKRMKFLKIPVGSGHGPIDKYRHSRAGDWAWGPGEQVGYIDFNVLNPLIGRGARALGISGAAESHNLGGSVPQQIEAAQRDVLNSFLHPILGPVARGSFTAVTGREAYLTGMRDERGEKSPQLFPAVPKKLKPGFFGGLTPGLYPNTQPIKKAGFAAETGAQTGAALRELNAFYGNLGEATGFLGEDMGQKGNGYLRMILNLNPVAPGIVANATNPYARARTVAKQRRAMGQ